MVLVLSYGEVKTRIVKNHFNAMNVLYPAHMYLEYLYVAFGSLHILVIS